MKKKSKVHLITVLSVIILILIVAIGYIGFRYVYGQNEQVIAKNTVNINTGNLPFLGNENARITIAEYGDYRCHYCKLFQDQVVKNKYIQDLIKKGTVKIVYKDFPFLSKDSMRSAVFLKGVYDQYGNQAYWKMHDLLYANQTKNKEDKDFFTETRLLSYANNILGENSAKKLKTSFNNPKYLSLVNESLNEAKKIGVDGTPVVFVNNHVVLQKPWVLKNIMSAIDQVRK